MHEASGFLNGACRSDQCLSRTLTTKHSLTILVGGATAKEVDLDLFEVKQADEIVEGILHVPHPAST